MNRTGVLGSFDGFTANIRTGKNIINGTLIYTKFHEDAHRIFEASTEIGWIMYFLRQDSKVAAENNDFKYCNRITAFINVLEKFMENLSEIVANTCELLAVKENGGDVKKYIEEYKKGKYEKYCFLFDYVNMFNGSFYDKFGKVLNAASGAMQKFDAEFVMIGLGAEISQLKEKLACCEPPEMVLQRILYGEIDCVIKRIELNNILKLLEEMGTLLYIQDYVSIIKDSSFENLVEKLLEDKEFLNLQFHKSTRYFSWDDINCKNVNFQDFIVQEADFVAIQCQGKSECVGYKYIGEKDIIESCFDVVELETVIDTVKYVMYDIESEEGLIEKLKGKENIILVKFFGNIEDYLEKIYVLNNNSKFIALADSRNYVLAYGSLTCQKEDNIVYFSVFDGRYGDVLYKMVERLGGEVLYKDDFDRLSFEDRRLFAYLMAFLFCLAATS